MSDEDNRWIIEEDGERLDMRSIFADTPNYEVVQNYVAPPMTEERVMWFGRGMKGKGPMKMDRPTQKFRIGAYIFKDPISWDNDGNFIVRGKKYTPKQVFALVQAEWRRMADAEDGKQKD